jgi:hypothetical protein
VEAQEPDKVASADEVTPPNFSSSAQLDSITGDDTIQPDPTLTSASLQRDSVLRLEGQGSVIVLGREADAALALLQHPEKLSKLIQGGSLFTVPRGTAIKLIQRNSLVIKVRIMEGSMVGQEGWAQPEQAQSPPGDSVKSPPGLPAQERSTEVELHPESTKPVANVAASREPTSTTGQKPIAPDSKFMSAVHQPDQASRLEGKGSVVVLGWEPGAALELFQHPETLSKLIERGSLFTVGRGTAIKLLQGNRLGNTFLIKVRIMEGPKAGLEGWAPPSQVSP